MQADLSLKTVNLSNGETIAYRDVGENSEVLVLVHGAMGSSAVWLHLIPKFTDKFRVIAPDLRGHGKSSYKNLLKSHDETAEDLKLFFDAIGVKKFYLVGWSMGGGVSMKFTAKYPEYVQGLILHNSMGVQGVTYTKIIEGKPSTERITTEEEAINHPHPVFLSTIIAQQDKDKIRFLHDTSIYGGKGKPDAERLESSINDWLDCRCAQRLGHLANIYNITNEHSGSVDGTNEIAKIKCKTLILHGEKDKIVPPKEAERIKQLIGDNAELKIYPEAGHAFLEDYPEEFVQLVKDFCAKKKKKKKLNKYVYFQDQNEKRINIFHKT